MPITNDAKRTARFVAKLRRQQKRIYLLLKPHSQHDLDCHLDSGFNTVYARCNTCNTVLLDSHQGATRDQDAERTHPIPAAT